MAEEERTSRWYLGTGEEDPGVYEAIFDELPDAILIGDPTGVLRRVSHATEVIGGWPPEHLLGRSMFEFVHPDDLELSMNMFARAYETGESQRVRFRFQHASGEWLTLEINGRMLLDEEGNAKTGFGVVRDINEQVRLERERDDALLKAESANQAKSEFLSRMSHELRTPLNAILGFGQLMELDDLDEKQADRVGYIVGAGRHLLSLINQLLDINAVEIGKLTISIEQIRARTVVEDIVGLVAPLADSRGIAIAVEEIDPELHVQADLQRFRQVLLNLLSNAIKYNVLGGSVGVAVTSHDSVVDVSVSDTGPGIATEDQERLFQPFDRLGADVLGEVEGTGLGLALSRGLAEAMGGGLDVDSSLGRGSVFTLRLSLGSPEAVAAPDTSETAGTPAVPITGTVLYIEDNATNIAVIESLLASRSGVSLITAMNGRTGLALAMETKPELILLDLHLPDIDGDEVLALLKADTSTASIPVVILSADATSGQAERLCLEGAEAYVTKPFELRRLNEVLDTYLQPGS